MFTLTCREYESRPQYVLSCSGNESWGKSPKAPNLPNRQGLLAVFRDLERLHRELWAKEETAVRQLDKHYPDWRMFVVTEVEYKRLFEHHPLGKVWYEASKELADFTNVAIETIKEALPRLGASAGDCYNIEIDLPDQRVCVDVIV